MLQEAQKLDKEYDYYVFLDDDIEFLSGSFGTFEEDMERVQPDVGIANMDVSYLYDCAKLTYGKNPLKNIKRAMFCRIMKCLVRFAYWLRRLNIFKNRPYRSSEDPCFIAIKTSTLRETKIIPYHCDLDDTSWNLSCGLMHIFVAIFRLHVYTSARTVVSNTITESVTGNLRVYPKETLGPKKLHEYICQYTSQSTETYGQYLSYQMKTSLAHAHSPNKNRFVSLFRYFLVVLDYGNLFGQAKIPERAKNPMKKEFATKQDLLSSHKYNCKKIL